MSKNKELCTHGDSSNHSRKFSISGHIFNHETGCMDTIMDGKVVHSEPLMNPSPIKNKTLVVGSSTSLNFNYSEGPSKWQSHSGIIYKGKAVK